MYNCNRFWFDMNTEFETKIKPISNCSVSYFAFLKSTPKEYDILKSAIIKRSLDGRSIKGEMSYYETRQYYENWY